MFISTDIHGDLKLFYYDGLTANAAASNDPGSLLIIVGKNIHCIHA